MAVKKKGLGKGLDSLIPEKSNKPLAKEPAEEKRESESGSGIQMMKINMVEPESCQTGRSQGSPCYCKRVYRTGNSRNRFN